LSWLLLAFVLSGCADLGPQLFEVYALARDLSPQQALMLGPGKVEKGPLVFSEDDIVLYKRRSHEIGLTEAGAAKIDQVDMLATGRGFVVCVGGEPIYSGAFWLAISLQTYEGVVIELPVMGRRFVQIRLGFPTPAHFQGADPRSDPRIMETLRQAGKLYDTE
jgi:hypothetical protein